MARDRTARRFINVPVTPEVKDKVAKAAAKNGMTSAEYARRAINAFMVDRNEWAIPGPRKGSA